MKVIFLDVDGVLNCATTSEKTKRGLRFVEDRFVEKLKRIIDETNAEVVLSSNWRFYRFCKKCNEDFIELESKLAEYNIQFYGFTDSPMDLNEKRGYQIDKYLKANKTIDKFVILDDRRDMKPYLAKLVNTSFKTGLTDRNVEIAIRLLNN